MNVVPTPRDLRKHVQDVLHLLCESAPPNRAVNTDAHQRGFARAGVAGYLEL